MRLKDIMKTNVEAIAPTAAVEQALTLMHVRGIHHLVVLQDKRVVGVLSEDALQIAQADGVARVEDVMLRRFATAPSTATVREAANLLRGHTVGVLPIVDGPGKLVGILTVSDLLDLIGRGAERPVEKGRRWTLRHRGMKSPQKRAGARIAK